MQEQEPMTKTIKASVARQQFSQLLNDVFRKESRVVVEKSGIPVAAIISASDFSGLPAWKRNAIRISPFWMRCGKPLKMSRQRRLNER
jgi:prevent-host-death family protein